MTLTASDLLTRLESHGFRIEVENGRLLVSPADELTDELKAIIREHTGTLRRLVGPTGCAVVIDKGGGRFVAVPLAEYQRLTETLP